ncbi:hypothetical protein DEU56DRAFT_843702 [Suillus clintonianus]|uniref:uncharacterized protein n=1 Tax=Suillus clintonianus TaxID=1904413 RepID=UPI001B886533|nr:uncharacterized protein DEU56DRAFT_843702 [Suillus clintonianus]KAG2111446.1 hypothetical protein DEU56DRAFT_843702 [Suillus clintonianus]
MKLVWCILQSVFVNSLGPTQALTTSFAFTLSDSSPQAELSETETLLISFGSPDSRFLVRSLCTEPAVVICDAANRERGCRA